MNWICRNIISLCVIYALYVTLSEEERVWEFDKYSQSSYVQTAAKVYWNLKNLHLEFSEALFHICSICIMIIANKNVNWMHLDYIQKYENLWDQITIEWTSLFLSNCKFIKVLYTFSVACTPKICSNRTSCALLTSNQLLFCQIPKFQFKRKQNSVDNIDVLLNRSKQIF